jgi:hypothetical protein
MVRLWASIVILGVFGAGSPIFGGSAVGGLSGVSHDTNSDDMVIFSLGVLVLDSCCGLK